MAKVSKVPAPNSISPMLATLSDGPPPGDEWLYEIKWDGYRAIAYVNAGEVEISSRNNKNFSEKFYPITAALKKLRINAVLDGEIVATNNEGFPDFSLLQSWRSEADGHLFFYVFDILFLDGKDLTSLPVEERKSILHEQLKVSETVRISEFLEAHISDLFKAVEGLKMEGVMAKKKGSFYLPGVRTRDWLKVKTEQRQEVVIGGYTINENTSRPFSALLVGVFNGDSFDYAGSVGTGFSAAIQKELLKKFKPLTIKKCPFSTVPDYNKPSRFRPNPPKATAVWLKPELVCEISFRELTSDKALRHPSFKGLRDDKSAREVSWETTLKSEKKSSIIRKPKARERGTILTPGVNSQVRDLNGHELKFNNLNKVFWPATKITKGDMINYYYQVAPYILPHLAGRPQTLNRFPNGIEGKAFYQKDVKGKVPSWITTFPYYSEVDEREKEFLVCDSEETLLYIASMGCIEINTWSSKASKPNNPDYCIIDLDPDRNTFNQVIEAANLTREILKEAGVDCYCKTSGSTGLHVYIPLGGKYVYEECREFGRLVATILHEQVPGYTSIERQTKNRGRKMYIDFLQNRPQATVASVYSLRPKPGAPVSMPLHWEEVKKGLKITDFNITNAIGKIREQGDIFKPVLGKGIDLKRTIEKLEATFRK